MLKFIWLHDIKANRRLDRGAYSLVLSFRIQNRNMISGLPIESLALCLCDRLMTFHVSKPRPRDVGLPIITDITPQNTPRLKTRVFATLNHYKMRDKYVKSKRFT
jgi:hypothetical protein